MKKAVSVFTAAAMAIALFAGAAAAAERVYRLATDQASNFVTTVALQGFADEVAKRTDGRIKIQIYSDAQLGDETSYMEQIQYGGVDFAKSSNAPLANICEELYAMQFPYLFKDDVEMFAVLKGAVGEHIKAKLRESGLECVGFMDNGSRCFFTKMDVQNLADLKGKKIRVQSSELMTALIESLGAFPTSLPSTEVYSGLQTGVVDGAENNINIYRSDSLHEQAKFLLVDNHCTSPEYVLCNKGVWDSFSPEDRVILQEAMDHACADQISKWQGEIENSKAVVQATGVKISYPSAETLAEFRKAVQPVYDKFGGNCAELLGLIEKNK